MPVLNLHYEIFDTPAAMAHAAAARFVSCVKSAVDARGVARVAISGGSTPKLTFQMLADEALSYRSQVPWDKLELYWVDERCVPPDHDESNYRMTKQAMLSKVPLPAKQVFRMEGELDPEKAAAKYESLLRENFRLEGAEMPTFDSIALGMGPDGHTASLFPHTAALHELMRIVVANHVPQKDSWRITLTGPVINQGRDVVFLIQGADKATILKEVLLGKRNPETYPSQLIRPHSGSLTLLLDRAAAADLPTTGDKGVMEGAQ